MPYKNKADQLAAQRRYRKSSKGKATRKRLKAKYLSSEKGKKATKAYTKKYYLEVKKPFFSTSKGKEKIRKYNNSKAQKEANKRYARSEKGKIKQKEHNKKYFKTEKGQLAKMWNTIRLRIGNWTFRHKGKRKDMVKIIGCSREFLRKHLEKQFKPGMTWENHGKWHIDHIIPLAKFDPNNIEDVKISNNYTNLQPLWAKENIKKKNKY